MALGQVQQDSEEDDQETDNEFPESEEINRTGLSGKRFNYINLAENLHWMSGRCGGLIVSAFGLRIDILLSQCFFPPRRQNAVG